MCLGAAVDAVASLVTARVGYRDLRRLLHLHVELWFLQHRTMGRRRRTINSAQHEGHVDAGASNDARDVVCHLCHVGAGAMTEVPPMQATPPVQPTQSSA